MFLLCYLTLEDFSLHNGSWERAAPPGGQMYVYVQLLIYIPKLFGVSLSSGLNFSSTRLRHASTQLLHPPLPRGDDMPSAWQVLMKRAKNFTKEAKRSCLFHAVGEALNVFSKA